MATQHTYIFMRHGEAEHNVAALSEGDAAYLNPAYKDAPLTAKGREQILESARELLKTYPKIDGILCSPLTRAIQTARCVKEIIPCDQKILLLDPLIECQGGGHICNERLDMPLLQDLNPDVHTYCIPDSGEYTQNLKTNTTRETLTKMQWRGHSFIQMNTYGYVVNKYLPKKSGIILVVSHHETLQAWLGVSLKNSEYKIVKNLKEIKTPHPVYPWT
jgi:broad specificity phosphatase PhoE